MNEAFLHYVWQHQMLKDGLTSTDGQPIVVQKAGMLNRDAGPDFFDARLSVDGVEWVGNVEIHMRSSDWQRHGHSSDPAYNNVVLHVVYEHDCDIVLQNGRQPLTLEVRRFLHPAIVANYDSLTTPSLAEPPYCASRLHMVPEIVKASVLDRLVAERIENKSQVVRRMLDESHGGWEQTCYWMLARYFGGKVNALPFELLAKATDQRMLARWRDNPQRIEALLMGQAGLLDDYFKDDYPRMLQTDYEAIRSGAGLKPIDGHLWKFYRIRPTSFPTIRISQFANLLSQAGNLFPTLLAVTNVDEMLTLLSQSAAGYWDNHYQFDVESPSGKRKTIGRMQAQTIIINAWIPVLFVYGEVTGEQRFKDQAIALLEQLPPEDNAVTRRWYSAGITPANAAESQAVIQLETNYCISRDCLGCGLGYHIIKQI